MLMLDYLKYKCYRMKYRLHMGTAHMACDPGRGLAMKAKTIEIILKGDAFEDAAAAIDEGRKVCLEGVDPLLVEQEGGEFKCYSLREYHIMRRREYRLTFGKE